MSIPIGTRVMHDIGDVGTTMSLPKRESVQDYDGERYTCERVLVLFDADDKPQWTLTSMLDIIDA